MASDRPVRDGFLLAAVLCVERPVIVAVHDLVVPRPFQLVPQLGARHPVDIVEYAALSRNAAATKVIDEIFPIPLEDPVQPDAAVIMVDVDITPVVHEIVRRGVEERLQRRADGQLRTQDRAPLARAVQDEVDSRIAVGCEYLLMLYGVQAQVTATEQESLAVEKSQSFHRLDRGAHVGNAGDRPVLHNAANHVSIVCIEPVREAVGAAVESLRRTVGTESRNRGEIIVELCNIAGSGPPPRVVDVPVLIDVSLQQLLEQHVREAGRREIVRYFAVEGDSPRTVQVKEPRCQQNGQSYGSRRDGHITEAGFNVSRSITATTTRRPPAIFRVESNDMAILIIALVIAGIIFLPGIWVQRVLEKYSTPADRYSGTGAELARHLLDRYGMSAVGVEETDQGDHYDPIEKVVRLTPDKFGGRSLTAITVAAHEVGHALQDHNGYKPLRYRTRLVRATQKFEKLGAGILMVSPFVGAVTRVPGLGILMFLGGMMTLGTSTLVHLVTLPTEVDASFNRALPMLSENDILIRADRRHARKILKAAAFTYVSASLMSLLNIARWLAILRR